MIIVTESAASLKTFIAKVLSSLWHRPLSSAWP